jgi:hypothetical protein
VNLSLFAWCHERAAKAFRAMLSLAPLAGPGRRPAGRHGPPQVRGLNVSAFVSVAQAIRAFLAAIATTAFP